MSGVLESSLEQVDILGKLIGTFLVCCSFERISMLRRLIGAGRLLERLIENWYGGLERLFNR